jgi:hypothetical protein
VVLNQDYTCGLKPSIVFQGNLIVLGSPKPGDVRTSKLLNHACSAKEEGKNERRGQGQPIRVDEGKVDED